MPAKDPQDPLADIKSKVDVLAEKVTQIREDTSKLNAFKDDLNQFKASSTAFQGTTSFWGKLLAGSGLLLIGAAIGVGTSINGLQANLGKDEQRLADFQKNTEHLSQIASSLPTSLEQLKSNVADLSTSIQKVTDANSQLANTVNQHAATLKDLDSRLNDAISKISALSAKGGSESSKEQTIRIFCRKEDFKGNQGNSYLFEINLPNPVSEAAVYGSTLKVQWLDLPAESGPWQASALLNKDGKSCRLTVFSLAPKELIYRDFAGLLSLSSR